MILATVGAVLFGWHFHSFVAGLALWLVALDVWSIVVFRTRRRK